MFGPEVHGIFCELSRRIMEESGHHAASPFSRQLQWQSSEEMQLLCLGHHPLMPRTVSTIDDISVLLYISVNYTIIIIVNVIQVGKYCNT